MQPIILHESIFKDNFERVRCGELKLLLSDHMGDLGGSFIFWWLMCLCYL